MSLLSGRNFETRSDEDAIAEASFLTLSEAVITFMNETLFKCFVMIIKYAGFVDPKLMRSQNALNFAYVLFLHLKAIRMEDALTATSRISMNLVLSKSFRMWKRHT